LVLGYKFFYFYHEQNILNDQHSPNTSQYMKVAFLRDRYQSHQYQ
jgi:hypothetical protein